MERPPGGTTGPPDRQVLRLVERQFLAESFVEDTHFEPNAHEPRLLRVHLDSEGYPRPYRPLFGILRMGRPDR